MNIQSTTKNLPFQNQKINDTCNKRKKVFYPKLQKILCKSSSFSAPISDLVQIDDRRNFSEAFQQFIHIYHPKMSSDIIKINSFVERIKKGDYAVVASSECPYLALSALARNALTILDIANILTMHEMTITGPPYGNRYFFVGPLLDQKGQWTSEALKYCIEPFFNTWQRNRKTLRKEGDEELRRKIKILPRYQRIFFAFFSEFSISEFTHPMSFQVSQLVNESFFGHRFGIEPRLGLFHPIDIIEGITKRRVRLCHIPFPGIPSPSRVHDRYMSPLDVCGHDRTHVEIYHLYSPNLIEALIEWLIHFQRVSKMETSKEIWEISDMSALNLLDSLVTKKTPTSPTEQLNLFFNSEKPDYTFSKLFGDNPQVNFFGWVCLLYTKKNELRWQKQFGIQLKELSILSKKRELLFLAEPYIKKDSLIQKIIKLQLLEKKSSSEQIDALKKLQGKKIHYRIIKVRSGIYWNHIQLIPDGHFHYKPIIKD